MNWHFPFYTQSPTNNIRESCSFQVVVPVDDTYTISYGMSTNQNRALASMAHTGILPNTTDWRGRFRPENTLETDLNIDREVQAHEKNTWRGYTGIESILDHDRGITESQGDIQDRSIEHLGTTDRMIILVRRRLIDAAKALRDQGTVPPGVENPSMYRQRSGSITLPKNVDVWEATKELREVFKRVPISQQIAGS